MNRNQRQVAQFFVLALALSWVIWIPALHLLDSTLTTLPVVAVGAFGPAAAAALLVRRSGGSVREWIRTMAVWRLPRKWYAVALGLPATVSLLYSAVLGVLGVSLTLSGLLQKIAMFLGGVVLVFFFGGGQEEPGWRGFALPRLQQTYNALTASVIIGVVWGLWHLPFFAFADSTTVVHGSRTLSLFLPYTLGTTLLSIVFTYLYNSTGGSVPLVMLLHASVNSSMSLLLVAPETMSDLPGTTGIPATWLFALFFAIWAIIAIAIMLRYGPATLAAGDKQTATTPAASD